MAESVLFTPFSIENLALKNRITMAPLYMGTANTDGTVSPVMIDHYREMAASGVSMVVVENTAITPEGAGAAFTLRIDHERHLPGLSQLAEVIHQQDALAFLQISHAGRFGASANRIAPSAVQTGENIPNEMTLQQIKDTIKAFSRGAAHARQAGFDGVEIHGAAGYLLTQFLSPRTNFRTDAYGSSPENRMRFVLEVVEAVQDSIPDLAVGYRFQADELVPDGLHLEDTLILAQTLAKQNIAYLSVTVGAFDSFSLPEYQKLKSQLAYAASYSARIKEVVPKTPVIVAGRIQTPEIAQQVIEEKQADLIALGRVLLADPLWPQKAAGIVQDPIIVCGTACERCMDAILQGKSRACVLWAKERQETFSHHR